MFICTWLLLWHPPVEVRTPLQGGAKKCQGVPKIFGSLRSPVRTPLSKTLKPPLLLIKYYLYNIGREKEYSKKKSINVLV